MTSSTNPGGDLVCGEPFAVRNARGADVALGMQSLWLTGHLTPFGARLMIRHSFRSEESTPLELLYAFPLPREGAVRRFRLTGPGWSVASELRPGEQARREYERAISDGHTAAHVAQHRDGVMNLALGNIKPGAQLTLWLELFSGVEATPDGYRFRYPFILPPRYHAEARFGQTHSGELEMELPADFGDMVLPRWTKDPGAVPTIGFHLDAQSAGEGCTIASPSHQVEFSPRPGGRFRIHSPEGAVPPRGDLEVHVRARKRSAMVLCGPAGDGRIHGIAQLPVPEIPVGAEGPRRVAFLIDRSGSMQGERIAQAKRAVQACLGLLNPADQIAVFAFDNDLSDLSEGFQDVTAASLEVIRKRVEQLDARGGTDLGPALKGVLSTFGQNVGDIVLVTDGDVSGSDEIIQQIATAGIRVHTLGIETAAAERMLEEMASQTGGQCRCIRSGARVDGEILMLFRAVGQGIAVESINAPGATDLRIEPPASRSANPGGLLPVMFSASHLNAVTVEATLKGSEKPQTIRVTGGMGSIADGELAKLLRGARLQTLAEIRTDSDGKELESIGLAYGLANRSLSLIAVVRAEGDTPGELPKTRVISSLLPESLELETLSAPAAACAGPPPGLTRSLSNKVHSGRSLHRMAYFSAAETVYPLGKGPAPKPAKPAALIDCAYDLLAQLSPDGSLPAATAELRLARTALLWALLVHLGGKATDSPFALHVTRIERFLAPHATADPRLGRLIAEAPPLKAKLAEDLFRRPNPGPKELADLLVATGLNR